MTLDVRQSRRCRDGSEALETQRSRRSGDGQRSECFATVEDGLASHLYEQLDGLWCKSSVLGTHSDVSFCIAMTSL